MEGMLSAQARVTEMAQAARDIEDFKRSSKGLITEDMFESQLGWLDGAKMALAEYQVAAFDTFTNVQDVFTSGLGVMENALVDFVTTGKLEFKDLLNSILEDLARLMVRQNITGPLAGALGGALSGMFGGGAAQPLSVTSGVSYNTAFGATGGVFSGPTSGYPAVMHGTEAIVPLSGGRSIPVEMKGGGDVQVVINNNSGQQASVSETQTGDGMRQILVTIGNDIRRMGPVGQAIGGRFGLTAKGMA
jgi:phage-related minor tail protein